MPLVSPAQIAFLALAIASAAPAAVVKRAVTAGNTRNLLQPEAWTGFREGFARYGDALVCDNGGGAVVFDGVPVIVTGKPREGFQVRDVAAASDFVDLDGRGKRPALDLKLAEKRERHPEATIIDAQLADGGGKDRAVTLVYALPASGPDWRWLADPRTAIHALPPNEYATVAQRGLTGGGALQRYYEMFPDYFRSRTPRQGIWMPFHQIGKVEGWEDFGFKFKEGNNETEWDDAHGILTFRYTEPMTWWMPMPKEMPRTLEAALEEARRLAAAGKPNAQALFTSGFHGEDGRFTARFLDTPWTNGAVWSMNSLPGISGPRRTGTRPPSAAPRERKRGRTSGGP
jgi:hypothetical protein